MTASHSVPCEKPTRRSKHPMLGRPKACLGVAKVACHAAEDGAPVAQAQTALFKAQADAGPDGAERLEGQGLRVVQAEQRGHQLLQLVLSRLPQDQSVLLQPSQSHKHWSVPTKGLKQQSTQPLLRAVFSALFVPSLWSHHAWRLQQVKTEN